MNILEYAKFKKMFGGTGEVPSTPSECDEQHVIPVETLPTEGMEEGTVYKVTKEVPIDLIDCNVYDGQVYRCSYAYIPEFEIHAVPTRPTENILETVVRLVGEWEEWHDHVYYIEDENILAEYLDGEWQEWCDEEYPFNGCITDVREAVAQGSYLLTKSTDTYYTYSPMLTTVAGKYSNDDQTKDLLIPIGDEGHIVSALYAKTRPTEDIRAFDLEASIVPLYYIEDEEALFVYGYVEDLCESGDAEWIPFITFLDFLWGEENPTYKGSVEDINEITEEGVYAVISKWKEHPELTNDITNIFNNGIFDVSDSRTVKVNVESGGETIPEGGTLTEFLEARNGQYLFYECTWLTSVPKMDTSKVTDMRSMFNGCSSLTTIPEMDTSSVTNMGSMFNGCGNLTTIPEMDTSKVTHMNDMFKGCSSLTTIPEMDTSSIILIQGMFNGCGSLTSVPKMNTSNLVNMSNVFSYCSSLTTIPEMDIRNVTITYYMFDSCRNLTDVRFRNIQTNLKVGSGTSYGHLLTVESLTHLIYELRDTGSSKTLTVGSANLEKLANVYVKLVDITDEMRAEDDLIDEKLPFVVCESTDEGAALITDYVAGKNWSIV